jgi:hypothetical protein
MFVEQAYCLCVLADDIYGDDQAAEAKDCLLRAAQIYESVGQHGDASRCREQAAAMGSGGGSS